MFNRLRSAFARWFASRRRTPPDAALAYPSPATAQGAAADTGNPPSGDGLTVSPPATGASPAAEPILIQREVLNVDLAPIGHELALREDLRGGARRSTRPVLDFLDRMLLDQLFALDASLFRNRIAYLQLRERSLQQLDIDRLPGRASVLIAPADPLHPAEAPTREMVEALRRSGREVWLDDCLGTPWFASLAESASGAVTRLAQRTPGDTASLVKLVREKHRGLSLAAWEVATFDEFEMARGLGCQRFSGSFVTQRENWQGNKILPQTLNVALLINKLHQEADIRAIAEILKQDLALSYRLLRYLNSAALGLNHKIASIEQGLLVLGQNELQRWLTLVMLSCGKASSPALVDIALTRARFLELAGTGRLAAEHCERLFVLGLFSVLDVALKVPLETAIQPLNLPETMKQALLQRQGPYGPYLSLADACERGDTGEIIRHALAVGLTTRKVAARQLEALNWAAEITTPAQHAQEQPEPIGA